MQESVAGQKAKYSLRADVFRSAPDTGHRSIGSAFPFGARFGLLMSEPVILRVNPPLRESASE
jgi:hypothetical protein